MKTPLLLLGCVIPFTLNAQFILDDQFANGGLLALAAPTATEGHLHIAKAGDGTFYVAGLYQGPPSSTIFHVLADGNLDAGFGVAGRIVLDSLVAFEMVVQADGKLLCAATGGGGEVIVRLLPDGSFDPGFGTNGIVTLTGGSIRDLNELSDGRIAALAGDGSLVVPWMLLSDGSLDPSYTNNGNTVTFPSGTHRSLILDNGEALIMSGGVRVQKLDADGNLDPSFGNGTGVYAVDCSCGLRDLAVDPEGRVLVYFTGGFTFDDLDHENVHRISSSGVPDPTFGIAGAARLEGIVSNWSSMDVDPLGRVITTGLVGLNDDAQLAVVRYTVDGVPDVSFAPGGYILTDVPQPEPVNIGVGVVADGTDKVKVVYGVRTVAPTVPPFGLSAFVDATIGLDELAPNSTLSMFPNPAHDVLVFAMEDARMDRITLRDALGRIVLVSDLQDPVVATLNVSRLAKGVYNCAVLDSSGRNTQRTVVIE